MSSYDKYQKAYIAAYPDLNGVKRKKQYDLEWNTKLKTDTCSNLNCERAVYDNEVSQRQ